MSSERITLSYQHPDFIDRDTPAEVRSAVLEQLIDLSPKLRELVEASSRQIMNAAHDEIVDAVKDEDEPIKEAARRLQEWEDSDAGAAVGRLLRLAHLLERSLREVAAS